MTVVNGYRAVLDDAEYDAGPDGDLVRLYSTMPVPGFDPVSGGRRFRRIVLASDVGWLGYVRSTATVDGHDAVLVLERDGQVLVDYHDPDGWTPASGPEFGVWRRWVSPDDVRDRQEHRWSVR